MHEEWDHEDWRFLERKASMIGCVKTVTLEDPDFAGTYTVERRGDGALVLEPVMTEMHEIRDRLGSEPASVEEFEAQYGRLLPDDEG